MKLEPKLGADEVIRALSVRHLNAQADGFSARLGGAQIGSLHDSRPAPRADDKPPGIVAERHGPGSDAPSQFTRFLVIAGHLERRPGVAHGGPILGSAAALPSFP